MIIVCYQLTGLLSVEQTTAILSGSLSHQQYPSKSDSFLVCLYESLESYCCHFVVGVGVVMGVSVTLQKFKSKFLCDGAIRRAILYADRSYFELEGVVVCFFEEIVV